MNDVWNRGNISDGWRKCEMVPISYYNSANLCLSFRLSGCPSVHLKFDLHENRSHGLLQPRPTCCSEPDDVQYDLSLYGCGQIIELNDFCVLFAVPSTPKLCLRLWRPRITDCAIMSPRSQLHAVLIVAIPERRVV